MLNFLGKHKIGIIGDANCGKTVFLTSLLWNLEAAQLYLGKKHEIPTNFELDSLPKLDSDHRFDYAGNQRYLKDQNKWPAKTTTEYALAKCSYKLRGHLPYNITFLDIPGDRMADILIWQKSSYAEWSAATLDTWRSDPLLSKFFKPFIDSIETHNTAISQLTWTFKVGLRSMYDDFIPQISPSTLYFAVGDKKTATLETDEALMNRPIWKDGDEVRDFFPLPWDWKKASADSKEIYAKCEKNYEQYRKKVVVPLFKQIASCDGFIYCIDILGILAQSPTAFHRTQEEINSFMNTVMPGLFGKLIDTISRNPMRIAFVATKSDKVYDENLAHLENLLKDIVRPYRKAEINDEYFTCTAWKSTTKKNGFAICDVMINKEKKIAIIQIPPLPDAFDNNWNGEDYQLLETSMIPIKVDAKPPQQTGIDSILNFVIDDIH